MSFIVYNNPFIFTSYIFLYFHSLLLLLEFKKVAMQKTKIWFAIIFEDESTKILLILGKGLTHSCLHDLV